MMTSISRIHTYALSRMILCLVLIQGLLGCAVIREGQVGVKRTLGKYSERHHTHGLKVYNPFISKFFRVSTQTENLEVALVLPSKEGLNIVSEVSILYHIEAEKAASILRSIGQGYEKTMILPVFRSTVADVSARYFAKDMHTQKRSQIEAAIKKDMATHLQERGIVIESVLLKSIKLPASLAKAIEEKLEAEQQAQRMQFVLQQTQQEAENARIRANGVRDAQQTIAEGLSPMVIQFNSIEALKEMARSPNAKIIVTDGDLPIVNVLENTNSK